MAGDDSETGKGAAPLTAARGERRATPRVPVRMHVRFDSGSAFAKAYTAYAANMGGGGICLLTRRAYSVGEPLRLRLDVAATVAIELTGQVAWVRPGAAIGVRFDGLEEGQRRTLLEILRRHGAGTDLEKE